MASRRTLQRYARERERERERDADATVVVVVVVVVVAGALLRDAIGSVVVGGCWWLIRARRGDERTTMMVDRSREADESLFVAAAAALVSLSVGRCVLVSLCLSLSLSLASHLESNITMAAWWSLPRILAPLVGGSDLSFRLLARSYGAQVTFTEMCVAEYYLATMNNTATARYKSYTFEFDASDRPLVLQLAGTTAAPIIALANHAMFDGHIDGVDLNCGCPQSCAENKGFGAALLRDADHLVALCAEISRSIKYPLSVKMRLHKDVDTTIGLIGRLVREGGVAAVSVHARYAHQRGSNRGSADWDALRRIRAAFPETPIIGNGGIGVHADMARMRAETGVDGAMAGYAALLDPSAVFSEQPDDVRHMVVRYLDIATRHHTRLVDMQRHLEWMLRAHLTYSLKPPLFQSRSLLELREVLNALPLDPPLVVPELFSTTVQTPKPIEAMSEKMQRRLDRKRLKHEQKARNKRARLDASSDAAAAAATTTPSTTATDSDSTSDTATTAPVATSTSCTPTSCTTAAASSSLSDSLLSSSSSSSSSLLSSSSS